MTRDDHIPALDGIRALAALLVVTAHLDRVGLGLATPPLAGALGVGLFFALSGFLMAFLYLDKPADTPALIHYAAARLGRVVPLYWLVVLVSFAISRVAGPSFVYFFTPEGFARQMLFAGSKPPFWSIPPEVQFYGVFVLLWWLAASGRLRRWAAGVAAATAGLVLTRSAFPGITVFSVLHIFLLGVIAGATRRALGGADAGRGVALSAQVVALGLLAAALVGAFPPIPHVATANWSRDRTIYDSIAIALTLAAAIFAFSFDTALARALFANRAMRRLGAYSFSIYLLHEPLMVASDRLTDETGLPVAARLAVALAVVFAVASISFVWFERPMQRRTRSLVVRLLAARARAIEAPPPRPRNV